jgi:hypothetical protein
MWRAQQWPAEFLHRLFHVSMMLGLSACPSGTGLYLASLDGTRSAVSAHPGHDPMAQSRRQPQYQSSGRAATFRAWHRAPTSSPFRKRSRAASASSTRAGSPFAWKQKTPKRKNPRHWLSREISPRVSHLPTQQLIGDCRRVFSAEVPVEYRAIDWLRSNYR